jgi:hypothetical protein
MADIQSWLDERIPAQPEAAATTGVSRDRLPIA